MGIECNANSADGFRAILKERFTDFVVNEIGLDGEVVHLTSLEASVDDEIDEREQAKRLKLMPAAEPPPKTEEVTSEREPKKASAPESTSPSGDDLSPEAAAEAAAKEASRIRAAVDEFTKLAGEVEAARLKVFLEQPGVLTPAPEGTQEPLPLILASSNDKGYRTKLHTFFGLHLQLPTDTVEPPADERGPAGPMKKDSKRPNLCIRVHAKKHLRGGGGGGGQKRGREGGEKDAWNGHKRWPDGVPQFLEFTLCKENKDTGDAIGILSRILHVKPKAFGFAGTKDRRGVTSQRMTLFRVRAARMAKLNLHGMRVGNYRYVKNGLGLGDLKGNVFTLTLRGIEEGKEQTVARAVSALQQSGYINYFGLQRFGSHSVATHTIGAALLRGDWAEAIDLILRPRDGDKHDAATARAVYKEKGDIEGALKLMPRFCVAERGLLEAMLRQKTKDLIAVLAGIPRTTRKMYVHAYQSYLWNKAASERVRLHGVERVVAGDLVLDTGCDENFEEIDEDRAGDDIFSSVHEVTESEAAAGIFKITDVVLPQPGCKVIYSEPLQKLYEELCEKDGVQLIGFAHPVREYSFGYLTGTYRRLIVKPDAMEHSFIRYSDPKVDLTETDLSRIAPTEGKGAIPHKDEEGKLLALRLSLALPTSSYATMCIRELLKSTSAQAAHKAMTLADDSEDRETATLI